MSVYFDVYFRQKAVLFMANLTGNVRNDQRWQREQQTWTRLGDVNLSLWPGTRSVGWMDCSEKSHLSFPFAPVWLKSCVDSHMYFFCISYCTSFPCTNLLVHQTLCEIQKQFTGKIILRGNVHPKKFVKTRSPSDQTVLWCAGWINYTS